MDILKKCLIRLKHFFVKWCRKQNSQIIVKNGGYEPDTTYFASVSGARLRREYRAPTMPVRSHLVISYHVRVHEYDRFNETLIMHAIHTHLCGYTYA